MALDAVAILERLVGFDTVSAKSNLALIDWFADYLDGVGIESSLTRNGDRGRVVPGGGNPGGDVRPGLDLAHKPNEYITAEQRAAGAQFLDRLPNWAYRGSLDPGGA
jgi:acetylornithine deacetylase/succinyl-diaminopimelate desuccinylase-like protein